MNRKLFRIAAQAQLVLALFMATGCSPTQPFFLNERPNLDHYLNASSSISYPDVDTASLPDALQAEAPLTVGNHEYQFYDLTLEECVAIALNNSKFFVTTAGNAEFRNNVASQFTSSQPDQLGSIYDVAIQQTTTQSVPLVVDGLGNRTLPNGVLRANQVGGVEDALAEFDAQVSAFAQYGTTDRPRNTGFANTINPPLSVAVDGQQQVALSKRFATGGVGTIRQTLLYNRNNTDTVSGFARAVPSDYTVAIEAQVQHPLLRNRGTMINRIPVVLASLNEDIELTEFEIQVRNLVRDVENAYWDLYIAYRNVSTSIIARNSAQATAQQARLQFENGAGTKQEVSQANGQYFDFDAQLISALAGSNIQTLDPEGVYGRERNLRELMGLAPTDGRLVRPIEEPTLVRVGFDWEEIKTEALYLSPELRRGRFIVKQRDLELVSARNQILPEVNLSLLYRWVGVGDTLSGGSRNGIAAPAPGSNALEVLTGGDFQEGTVRLEYTGNGIGGRRERARIRNSQLRAKQSRAYLEQAELLIISQLSDAVARVATHYQLLQVAANRWQSFEIEVEARLAEFRSGNSDINVVLQSQQRLASAQIDYYRTLAEYNKSIGYVDYLRGTSLVNAGVTLAEGTWDKKAYQDALERARERSAGKHWQYGVSRPGVVRRDTVGNAAAAHHAHANPAIASISDTTLMPPSDLSGGSIVEGSIIEGSIGGLDGVTIDATPFAGDSVSREPMPSNVQPPLDQMFDSPAELQQAPVGESIQPTFSEPLPAPGGIEPTMNNYPPSTSNVIGSGVRPASYTRGVDAGVGIGGDATASATPDAMAPKVRRRPLPQ